MSVITRDGRRPAHDAAQIGKRALQGAGIGVKRGAKRMSRRKKALVAAGAASAGAVAGAYVLTNKVGRSEAEQPQGPVPHPSDAPLVDSPDPVQPGAAQPQ